MAAIVRPAGGIAFVLNWTGALLRTGPTNYNAITWSAVTNAVSYDIYRTTGGATQGKMGNPTGPVLNDTGLVGGGETAPSTNTTGAIQVADGSVSAPGLSFVNDTNTGLHNPGNQLYLTVNGTNRALLDSSGLSLGDVLGLGATVGSRDVFLTRDAATTLALKNGN